jgi:hypothetical protein
VNTDTDVVEAKLAQLEAVVQRLSGPMHPLPAPPNPSRLAQDLGARQDRARRLRAEQAVADAEERRKQWEKGAPRRERLARKRAEIIARIEARQAEILDLERELGEVR